MGSALKRRDGIRAFVALGMPEPIQDALERLQESLPASRLVAPETLHLTLAFLDTQPEQVVAEVNEASPGNSGRSDHIDLARGRHDQRRSTRNRMGVRSARPPHLQL